jgi:hypothetical protein
MPKRAPHAPDIVEPGLRQERAKAAFEAVVEGIHDDNKVLEGRELWETIRKVFEIARPASSFKEPK